MWHDTRSAQLVDAVPEVEVLEGPVREALTLRDRLGRQVSFDQDAGDPTLAQFNGKPNANRPATHDGDVVRIQHVPSY
jgi:hypothetical protein